MKQYRTIVGRKVVLWLMVMMFIGSIASMTTPVQARSMWLGASYEAAEQWNERYIADKATMARIFESNAPKKFFDYPQIQRAWDDGIRRFSFSFHSSDESKLRVFGASLPKDAIVWATYLHEPENDIEKGVITLKAYKDNWVRLAPVMREYGLRTTSILMVWTLMDESGRDVRNYDLPKGTVDFAGYDAHIRDGKTPQFLYNLLKKEATRIKIPWVIPETSVMRGDPAAVARMEKFMKLMKKAPNPPRFIAYWNGSENVDARITNKVSKAFFGY